ncbi:hypothetical protein [Candidatus Vampirococcus lugosii]|uniref:Lipoprotein n=1 Tax=Candidatus Vampirococcus lugosii TaxID=2789015 RepID=A0ABS5QL30_9BACT|nr:hypothetical protein [Candidatus Vampirococcus lugosii]MBS8121901.1 hypothetical protein [Candidatus Vampirococcus lugosii]
MKKGVNLVVSCELGVVSCELGVVSCKLDSLCINNFGVNKKTG